MAAPDEAVPGAARRPEVSVLLPVRNGAAHLRESIESILSQSYSSLELLAIDDGSQDETPEILHSYARQDPRVRVIDQQPSGLIRTLNRALGEARADLLARQDADDLSEPGRIGRQAAYLEAHPDVALVGTSALVFDVTGDSTRVDFPAVHEQICDGLLLGNMFAHGSVMLRRDAVQKVGGYRDSPETHYVEDYDLWIRLARRHRVGNIRECLYRYRSNPQGVSALKAEEQARNAKNLIAALCRSRGYRDFWKVPDYSMRRWGMGGIEEDGNPSGRLSEEDLRRAVTVIRLLWGLGERTAALRRLNALVRHSPAALGREALGRLMRNAAQVRVSPRQGPVT